MFVHFKAADPRLSHPYQMVGASLEPSIDTEIISIGVDRDEYVNWLNNPSLVQKYTLSQRDGGWTLEPLTFSALDVTATTGPNLDLTPVSDGEANLADVLVTLKDGNLVRIEIQNPVLARQPGFKVVTYAVQADDHLTPVFALTSEGAVTLEAVSYNPDNVQVWISGPLSTVNYALKMEN